MLPSPVTAGEAGTFVRASANTLVNRLAAENTSGLRIRLPACPYVGSSRWHAACRAGLQATTPQHAELCPKGSLHQGPLVEYCGEEDWKCALSTCAGMDTVSVALGKFDAMHIGHR